MDNGALFKLVKNINAALHHAALVLGNVKKNDESFSLTFYYKNSAQIHLHTDDDDRLVFRPGEFWV